jgi:glycine cleavage system aminomethyltransferase T
MPSTRFTSRLATAHGAMSLASQKHRSTQGSVSAFTDTVDWAKGDFVGRDALLRQKQDPTLRTQCLLALHVADKTLPLWG